MVRLPASSTRSRRLLTHSRLPPPPPNLAVHLLRLGELVVPAQEVGLPVRVPLPRGALSTARARPSTPPAGPVCPARLSVRMLCAPSSPARPPTHHVFMSRFFSRPGRAAGPCASVSAVDASPARACGGAKGAWRPRPCSDPPRRRLRGGEAIDGHSRCSNRDAAASSHRLDALERVRRWRREQPAPFVPKSTRRARSGAAGAAGAGLVAGRAAMRAWGG